MIEIGNFAFWILEGFRMQKEVRTTAKLYILVLKGKSVFQRNGYTQVQGMNFS